MDCRTLLTSLLCSIALSATARGAHGQEAPVESEYKATAVVTATKAPRAAREVSSTVSVLSAEEIGRSPSALTDTLLRSLPQIATFRRSSSLSADPSSQGLNLRALGPSAVSRALLLVDGVPANDPFGGFVYFRALPRLSLARVEVVPSGASALYGSSALGGVVELITRPILGSEVQADASYGSFGTVQLAARAAHRFEDVSAALEGQLMSSEGYPVIAQDQRGPIDGDTPSRHGTLFGTLEYRPSTRLKLGSQLVLFSETQHGGTRFTSARAALGRLVLYAHQNLGSAGRLELTGYGGVQHFEQQRARIAAGRVSESLSAQQSVPAHDLGAALLWQSRPLTLLGEHALVAGIDGRSVTGVARERLYPPSVMETSLVGRDAGGQQWLAGMFLEDLYAPNSWLQLDAALRLDGYRNEDGSRVSHPASGEPTTQRFKPRQDLAWTPRFGVLVRPLSMLRVRASVYRAFRAPTLSELYRPFQVGTITTAANADLRPETLLGGEAGVELQPLSAATFRVTGFINYLDDPVTNRTLDMPLPDGSMRRRENLGRARVQGVEVEVTARVTKQLSARLSYTLTDARVTHAPGAAQLVHKHLVQAPAQRASALISFDDPDLFTAVLQVRAVSSQYEDDLNTLAMPGYALVDALVSRRIFAQLELFAAAENLLNATYLVGRAGVDTVGAPFMLRVGLMLRANDAQAK